MPYFPVLPAADDRRGRGLSPVLLRNARMQPASPADPQGYVLTEAPGRTLRVTPGGYVRGLFQAEGVRGGALFAVCGTQLYRISSTWGATALGTISGSEKVTFQALTDDLMIQADGRMWFFGQHRWILNPDGTPVLDSDGIPEASATDSVEALTEVFPNLSGPGAPASMAVVAGRIATHADGLDVWDWSAPLHPWQWPDEAFAQSARRPDALLAQVELGGDLWHFGRSSIQVWRATGGIDADAFDTLGNLVVDLALVGKHAWCRVGSSIAFIAVDQDGGLGAFVTSGYSIAPVPHRPLEEALRALSAADLPNVRLCAWADGSQQCVAVRLPNQPGAFVYDVSTRSWVEDHSFGALTWRGGFTARAYGKTVIASPDEAGIYTLEPDVFSDAGNVLERVMTVKAPLAGPMPIASLVIDMAVRGQPLSGQGSAPLLEVVYSRDGGRTTSDQWGDVRTCALPGPGEYRYRPKVTRLGRFDAMHGLWLRLRLTDPVGFAIRGVWVNEDPR